MDWLFVFLQIIVCSSDKSVYRHTFVKTLLYCIFSKLGFCYYINMNILEQFNIIVKKLINDFLVFNFEFPHSDNFDLN